MTSPARRRRLEVEHIGDVTVVNFVDRKILDEQNIQIIGEQLFSLVDEENWRKILLNFSNVEYLSSAALGKLITVRRYHVFAVQSDEVRPVPLPDGIGLDDLGEADLESLARIIPRSELERRLRRGEHGIVARELGGRTVGCVWLAPEPRRRTFPVPIELALGETYADGLYVTATSRGHGIGTALSAARRSRARRLGFSTIVAHTRSDNLPALRVQAAQAGNRRETVMIATLLGRWRLVRHWGEDESRRAAR